MKLVYGKRNFIYVIVYIIKKIENNHYASIVDR